MDSTDGNYTRDEKPCYSYMSSTADSVLGSELSTSPLPDSSERDLESSIMKSFLDDTPRHSSPMPKHSLVYMAALTDSNHFPLLYYPCSPCGCGSPQKPITVSDVKGQVTESLNCAMLLCQVNQKAVKRGFEFTLMVVGESGLGKSTLINSLFLKDLYSNRDVPDMINKTVEISKKSVVVVEKGVKLRLNIVDTPGFGDALDNTNSWKAVVDYIDQQFEQYRMAEMSVNRTNIQDGRVHCCLYFISPTGHGLRQIDLEFMKALHNKVNIVPVLAKADTLTRSEIHRKKARIIHELDMNRIKICDFPEHDTDHHGLLKKCNFDLKRIIPFAVIGSNTTTERNGRRVQARVYPWGVVEVENPAHSDLVYLRNMLIYTHMQELKDMTEEILYENYRTQIMCQNQEPVN